MRKSLKFEHDDFLLYFLHTVNVLTKVNLIYAHCTRAL